MTTSFCSTSSYQKVYEIMDMKIALWASSCFSVHTISYVQFDIFLIKLIIPIKLFIKKV